MSFVRCTESFRCFLELKGIGNRFDGVQKNTADACLSFLGDTAVEATDYAGGAATEDSTEPDVSVHRQGEGVAGATGRFVLIPPFYHLHKCAKAAS